jgi:hypothetical protein
VSRHDPQRKVLGIFIVAESHQSTAATIASAADARLSQYIPFSPETGKGRAYPNNPIQTKKARDGAQSAPTIL